MGRRRAGAVLLVGAASVLAVGLGLRLPDDVSSASPQPTGGTPTPTTTAAPLDGSSRPASVLAALAVLGAPGLDPRDTSLPYVDILEASGGDNHWQLRLRGSPPDAATLHAQGRVLEYGLLIDGDGDTRADCEVGISTDAPEVGDYRVWVTNLHSEVKDERVGGPYGFPVEFSHPQEGLRDREAPERSRLMVFTFLGRRSAACARISEDGSFHAWAAVIESGQVAERDFATRTSSVPRGRR